MALQPRQSGGDLGRCVRGIELDAGTDALRKQFFCRDDDLTFAQLLGLESQGAEQSDEVSLRQLRRGGEAELGLHVLRVEQQDAFGFVPIAPSSAGLLKVVLQRAGDFGVDHQPDIGLVHPHAEGIGGGDHLQFAVEKATLRLLAQIGGKTTVITGARHALLRDDLCDGLRAPACGAEDHGGIFAP